MILVSPEIKEINNGLASIFLAGSIENDTAELWQNKVIEILKNDFNIFNPRRIEWNLSWKQSILDKNFSEQVNWELNHLDKADLILIYFDPNTKSPISLLELGLYAKSKKVVVCSPKGFWRRGNIEIVCNRFNIPLFDNLETSISFIYKKLKN